MAKNPKAPVRKSPVKIATLTHEGATCKHIPAAEYHAALHGLSPPGRSTPDIINSTT